MDNTQSARSSPGLENLTGSYSSCLTFSIEREADRARRPLPLANEDLSFLPIHSGLNGMLKNTTETGDIGQFSISSSLHPHAGTAKRWNTRGKSAAMFSELTGGKSNPEYRPTSELLGIDDRRRLPSYAREVMSDKASLYEPTSRNWTKRSQMMGVSGSRSYSMTQTSVTSDLPLANHKSSTSLRSQLDSGQLQRPRSPFAYPKRSKRPGFRPSSPMLAGRGRIDDCHRAEIERLQNVSGIKTQSPLQLHGHPKATAPLSIRSDFSRSTPSLLGISSSPRQPSLSPRVRTSEFIQDYTSRHKKYPVGHPWPSPSRSISSVASSANLYPPALPGSTTTTPGRRLPSSPLYYDYTEDFEVETTSVQSRAEPENLIPPPFLIERTIHEDRELSSEWLSQNTNEMRGLETGHTRYNSKEHHFALSDTIEEFDALEGCMLESEMQMSSPLSTFALSHSSYPVKAFPEEQGNFFAKLALKNGMQEYRKPEISKSSSLKSEHQQRRSPQSSDLDNHDIRDSAEIESLSNRSSSYSLGTHLPKFPKPPDGLVRVLTESILSFGASLGPSQYSSSRKDNSPNPKQVENSQTPQEDISLFPVMKKCMSVVNERVENVPTDLSAQSTSAQEGPSRSSQFYSTGGGLSGQTPEKDELPEKSYLPESQLDRACRETLYNPPISEQQTIPRSHGLQPLFQKMQNEADFRILIATKDRGSYVAFPEKLSPSRNEHRNQTDTGRGTVIPNFSHQLRISQLQSHSPMLAPKPISPARELRVKNSIPLLMKALPPVPTRESLRAISPTLTSNSIDLPFRFSPLLSDTRPTAWPVVHQGRVEFASVRSSSPQHVQSHLSENLTPTVQLLPMKLKLKSRSLLSIEPSSQPCSRPWDSSDSRQWTDQSPGVPPPSASDKRTAPRKSQKFKLRVTKSSSSSFGTIRVNKAARNRNAVGGPDLRHPNDLFTAPAGLTDIFRQVSSHFVPRKNSLSTKSVLAEEASSPAPKKTQENIQWPQQPSSVLSHHTGPYGLFSINPTEGRSFFSDDSSQIEGNGGLRKRFSNLRARIPVPYGSRPLARQSVDNPGQIRGIRASSPDPRKSRPTVMLTSSSNRSIPRERRHQLKKKILCWLRDTQTAVKGYAKNRQDKMELPSLWR